MTRPSPRSLRRAYVDWVEEQIEAFKDTIPRGELLSLADEVVSGLRVNKDGQYQLTEILLCNAMDRRIFRMLKLPGYRAWRTQTLAAMEAGATLVSFPLPERLLAAPPPPVTPPVEASGDAEDDEAEVDEVRLACVG